MKAGFVVRSILAGCLLAVVMLPSQAKGGEDGRKDMALRKIMKDIGANMQAVTDGISREDWALIEKTAPLIADHPQPPVSEKLRIIGFMGTEMGRFKGYDAEVHSAADSLGTAAKAKDGKAVIAAFGIVQTACYGCHRDFRRQFIEHFYGAAPAKQ